MTKVVKKAIRTGRSISPLGGEFENYYARLLAHGKGYVPTADEAHRDIEASRQLMQRVMLYIG